MLENENYIDAEEVTDLEVVRSQAQLSIRHEMSPESLRAQIARETEMQQIVTQYVRDHMVKDHHYYSFNEGGKPALTKDGAHRICSLFKVIPGPVDVEIHREDGGHFTVLSKAILVNQDGMEIASSRGSASTRESKYAYRWVNEKQLPSDVDKATLKSRSGSGKYGNYVQYQLPNPDLADLENTIIKMSEKRATVGAVNKLPLVSELFATDPDDVGQSAAGGRQSAAPRQNSKPTVSQPKSSTASPVSEPTAPAGAIQKAVDLAKKLQKDHGVDFESLAMQFLPEGVGKFSELTEDQAADAVPGLVELLNTKLAG